MRRLEDWIDYMEGEVDPKQLDQLHMLLKHSVADQVVLDNLWRLRKWVKWTDSSDKIDDIIENKKYEKNLHRQIMKNITSQSDQPQLVKNE